MRNKKGQFISGKRPKWLCDNIGKALKGKPKSKEFKENLKKIRTGWKFSEKTKDKIRQKLKGNKNGRGNKGRKLSEKHRKIIVKNLVSGWGKGLTKEIDKRIRKRSEKMIGHLGLREDKNPRWIKDRSKLAKRQKRNDSAYCWWVKQVKKRDNNICQLKDENCFGYNIVHHIKNWSEYPELRYNINNGITLCQAHHPRKRAEEKRLIPILEGLVSVSNV